MKPECLILTDARNLPHQPSYYGLIHGLTVDVLSSMTPKVTYSFIDQTRLSISELSRYSAFLDRTLVYTDGTQEIHRRAEAIGLPYLNPTGVMAVCASKATSYEVVKPTGVLQPETKSISKYDDLLSLIETSPGHKVVVKPECGGMGTGIYFLQGTVDGQVKVDWKERFLGHIGTHSSQMSVRGFYLDVMQSQKPDTSGDSRQGSTEQRWIGQHFVDSRGREGFAQDVRIIEQRGGSGSLVPAKIHGRRANCDIPLTNLDKGGYPTDVNEVLKDTGFTVDDLLETCNKVDTAIESHTGQKIGEIGHDLAIINDGQSRRICFIESNTMPGYVFNGWDCKAGTTTVSKLDNIDRGLLLRPMQYLEKLALDR